MIAIEFWDDEHKNKMRSWLEKFGFEEDQVFYIRPYSARYKAKDGILYFKEIGFKDWERFDFAIWELPLCVPSTTLKLTFEQFCNLWLIKPGWLVYDENDKVVDVPYIYNWNVPKNVVWCDDNTFHFWC